MPKTKTSPNKVDANRRNAKKSTGPRSAAGKAKSSRNAVKHGLLAGRIVLADHKDEDPQQFSLLLDGLLVGIARGPRQIPSILKRTRSHGPLSSF